MASAQLSAQARDNGGKGVARKLRSEGRIPAVVYGHGREPQALSIPTRELERLLDHISAESTVIDLDIDGKGSRTLIREIQRHPFKRQILHVDFQELVAGEKITVNIPVILVGVPDGVRMDGGVLDQVMRELEVEVDPSNIPNHIDVDVTKLTIGTSVHVRDITLPEGVESMDDGDATICVVSAPRAAVEETAAAAEGEATAEPEVIRAKKPEEDEGAEK
ncbi:MAG TPA: 50S ribosomal protein L25/general stress protein Ctc [Gemmatimonadaceae bacterium]|jgi:large subunit ribosomal protein L25|nr:50S ribosomal protein L25/general stress protein Ctc [Gemmatimonadaceae bacterium]